MTRTTLMGRLRIYEAKIESLKSEKADLLEALVKIEQRRYAKDAEKSSDIALAAISKATP